MTAVRVRCAALVRVLDRKVRVRLGAQLAGIPDLAAGLGKERRAVEHHFPMIAAHQGLDALAIAQQRQHAPLGFELLVAAKLAAPGHLRAAALIDAEATGGAGPLALRLHLALVAVHIHLQATFAGDVGRQIRRKAVSIVQ